MTRLFIENREIELDESVQFAITKQFEDLSNPTTIINDWSKTVSIPFTARNNEIFGHIYNPDRLTVYNTGQNLLGSPSAIKKWNGSAYENATLVDGNIVCDIETTYLQLCFQYSGWTCSTYQNYKCNNDSHMLEFVYDYNADYRVQFAFKNPQSSAPNNEVMFVYWDLFNMNLTPGETYVVSFTHSKDSNGNYVVSDFTLFEKQPYIGVNFDPLKKLDMRLQWGDTVLMTGYAKMNEIKQINGRGTYDITLFGQLGKIFQELQKITFDTTTDNTNYLIDGSKYVEEYINKELVASSWNSNGQNSVTLLKKTDNNYSVNDIIGFVPNNSFSEGFDYKSVQLSSTITNTFANYLGDSFKQDTGIDADTIIKDGLLPREYGEYRSYLQLPYVYWNKLFQMFIIKAEELTGYAFNLDETWFNSANPYWYDLVYILKTWDIKNGTESENIYSGTQLTPQELSWSRNAGRIPYSTPQTLDYTLSVVSEKVNRLENNNIRIDLTDIDTITNLSVDFYITGIMYNAYDLLFTQNNCFISTYVFTGTNGYSESKQVVVYRADTENESVINTVNRITNAGGAAFGIIYDNRYATQFPNLESSSKWGWHVTTSLTDVVGLNKQKFGNYVTITNTSNWLNNNAVFGAAGSTSEICYLSNSKIITKMTISTGKIRSNSYFTFNNLWDNKFNLFDEILKYCKMFRISIFVDDYNKQLTFIPFTEYFKKWNITDWTNKVDLSKDFVIKPVTFENKYILFNYDDNKTKLGEEYKTKYGVNYGDYRLTTDYNFNTKTNNLFKGIKSPITNTDNVLSFLNLARHNIVYSFPRETFVYNKDKDNKQVDTFGCFYIHNGSINFESDSSLALVTPSISDDSKFQQAKNTYMYTSVQTDFIRVYKYPLLDIVKDDNLCTFNIPKEYYTYINNYSGKHSIYYNFWENYLNELYNTQNKQITCYVNLKPQDWNTFNFNNFVKIGNQIYLVNKIYDYNVDSVESTKIDLITIQNISAYTTNNFVINDPITLSWSYKPYYDGSISTTQSLLGTYTSGSDVTFNNNQKTIIINGVQFTIDGNNIYTQIVSKYVEPTDIDFTVVLKNRFSSTSFDCQRYSLYPYPWIILEQNETEITEIPAMNGTLTLKWHGTRTEGLENKPTVTISIIPLMSGTGATIDDNSWAENPVKVYFGDDDDEERTEYSVNLTYALRAQQKVQIEVVDKEGWHETKTYNVV